MAEFSAPERFVRAAGLAREVQMVSMVEPQASSRGTAISFLPTPSTTQAPPGQHRLYSNKPLRALGHVGLQDFAFLLWSHLLT